MLPFANRMLCPFCLQETPKAAPGPECPSCHRQIHPLYLRNARELEPLPVQAIGWTAHGKSTFLYALTLVLTRMQVVWDGYEWQAGNEETRQAIEEINRHLEAGTLPDATLVGSDVPLLLLLRGLYRWGQRAFVYRDCAGEHFEKLTIPVENVPFLLKAKTLFLIASPDDLARQRQRTIDMLVQGLLTTLQTHGVDLVKDRRRLVVVVTKGDLIRELPPGLRSYLANDRVWRTLDQAREGLRFDDPAIDRYLARMNEVDSELREWIRKSAAGRNLINLAARSGLDLRFSLVSATGGPVGEGPPTATGKPVRGKLLEHRWDPRRVLDPLLWALTFNPPRSPVPFSMPSSSRPRQRGWLAQLLETVLGWFRS